MNRSPPTPDVELADLVSQSFKSASEGISVAVNLGVGLMDIAFAKALYDLAQEKGGIGHRLPPLNQYSDKCHQQRKPAIWRAFFVLI